ncbi:transketolase N-terminal domain/subunit/DNA-binding GntR family transcriptional regulator [Olsenella profusa DSM 13989]|uniref:UTRA domain-containing protein n=1 Tax=Olsenella profusa TaxID=138595 RepID=UPI00278A63A2|nr:UTRA domain-containing protein [Olsenella profusa]MDP9859113.1 transketolase N-terminal domain/subunit/DNA-binding GntR family transcriptional regulator [Olsenella profusa DSM 13989]
MTGDRARFPTPETLDATRGQGDELGQSGPLHARLASLLRQKIVDREWPSGMALPSEAELMEQFCMSRGTVRRALSSLVQDGYIVTRKGSGSFVAEGGLPRPATRRPLSFAALFRERGLRFTTRVLSQSVMGAPRNVAIHLGVGEGSPVLFLRRIRSVGARPLVCQESWESLRPCPGLERADFTEESLFDAVERTSGRHIGSSVVHYSSQRVGRAHAPLLASEPESSTLVLEQDICLTDGTPIEWSVTWMRPGTPVVGVSVEGPVREAALSVGADGAEGGAGAAALRRELDLRALEVRRGVLEIAHRYPHMPFHLGGALSMAEVVAVLLGHVMHTGADGTPWERRDRLVVSKAHASVALYPALLRAGIISQDDLDRGLFGPDAVLFKHPHRDPGRGIELSGGSLGMGLGYACGLALALRRRQLPARVFCIVGDGECDEGSVWESAAFAGHQRLSNLTVVVDANGMQLDGPTAQVLDNGPLRRKFEAFGFAVAETDGHDVLALARALAAPHEGPLAVVARTVKGRGLSRAENNVAWHDIALAQGDYERARVELGQREEAIRHG